MSLVINNFPFNSVQNRELNLLFGSKGEINGRILYQRQKAKWSYSRYPPSLHALLDWLGKSNTTCHFRGQTSELFKQSLRASKNGGYRERGQHLKNSVCLKRKCFQPQFFSILHASWYEYIFWISSCWVEGDNVSLDSLCSLLDSE